MKAKHFTGTTIADLDDFFIVNPANNSLDLSNYSLNQEIILKCDSSTTLNIVNSTVTNPRTNLDTTSTVKMSTGDVLSIVNLSSGIVLFTLGYDSSVTLEGNNFNGTNQLTKTGAAGDGPFMYVGGSTSASNVGNLNTGLGIHIRWYNPTQRVFVYNSNTTVFDLPLTNPPFNINSTTVAQQSENSGGATNWYDSR